MKRLSAIVLMISAALCVALAAAPARAEMAFPEPRNTGKVWRVYKDRWDDGDEALYQEFVRRIGWSKCWSIESCLNNDANPFRSDVDPELPGDCADMAYLLRAYFAWKMGLPFSYQNAMRTADGSGEDLRYSSEGNIVAGRRIIKNVTTDAPTFLGRIRGEVSTAMFRTHPETGGGRSHDDFYPVEISREAIVPGVVAYDIYGHVGIVYDILKDGRVLIIASHPDHTVSRSTYGPNFMRSKPELGAGLKAWRPIRVEGARAAADGALEGGELKAASNEEIADFSLEQYYGNAPHPSGEWHYGEFRYNDRTLKYYDYVRRKLASPDFTYDPIEELRFGLQTICGAIRERKIVVDNAILARMHLKPHPKKLPPNIFGTYGDWEAHSTPSRDARLKVSFIELRRDMELMVQDVRNGAQGVRYAGDDLPGDLLAAFVEEKDACTMAYWRSDATRARLNLAHIMERLFDLSFDPYHCPERRWGARGAELETCTDDAEKEAWYNAQRFLRNQAERTYDIRMDFTLDELKPPMLARPEDGGLGVEEPADADIRAYLYSLQPEPDAIASSDAVPLLTSIDYDAGDAPAGVVFPAWHERLARERARAAADE